MDQISKIEVDTSSRFRVRTITGFLTLLPSDFNVFSTTLLPKLTMTVDVLNKVKDEILVSTSIEVQTVSER